MFQVIKRNPNAWTVNANGERAYEIHGIGRAHAEAHTAFAEVDARNIAQGEGKPPWSVEVDGVEVGYDFDEHGEVEACDVVDALVEVCGYEPAEAEAIFA